ncbi:hypothetical protein QOZ80_7AG0570160 [Eleusine coracana subsp. coracana]|nr:hypothetical protein QOZ80_7AG0570160 [Eleusine coracana subsp. coracana]
MGEAAPAPSGGAVEAAAPAAVASAAAKLRVAPPMTWRTRLAVAAAGYLTDATARADGTINRRLVSFLDPAVTASPTPRNGMACRDIIFDPAHRFPAAYDDGFAALRFLDDASNHPLLLHASRCFLTGDSAGGNIAHHVARRYLLFPSTFRTVHLAGLIVIQPFFGGEARTPSELRLDGTPIVSDVARVPADRTHEACDASLSIAVAAVGLEDSPQFPPATVVVGGYDPLQDW